MQTNVNTINNLTPSKSFRIKFNQFKNSEAFLETAFAAISGVLIFIGFLLTQFEFGTLSVISFISAYIIGGFFKAKEGILETIETKKLNVELLMIFAAVGSALIGYWEEGAILIFIFAVSGALEAYTLSKSDKELTALMDMQPKEAWLIEDGIETRVNVEQLSVGDFILVKPGEQVPADGIITNGTTSIDQSAITGESIPIAKVINDEVFAGTLNGSGAITVQITKPNQDTLFQKIITMIQNAQNEKSPAQQFIDRFESTYVNIVLLVVSLMMFLPHYLLGWTFEETFYRAMVLLVVASPCAVVASITPATLSAISNGAKNGILFKGGVHIETLGNLKAIAFDKTGTLTKGKPEVTDFITVEAQNSNEILATVAAIENNSNHPLAQAVVRYYYSQSKDPFIYIDQIQDVSGWGIEAQINSEKWKIGKKEFMDAQGHPLFEQGAEIATSGKTVVYIQQGAQLVGLMAFKDVLREETKEAIHELKKLGIEPIMLTGDNNQTAGSIAKEVGIEHYIAECLPENKVNEVNKIKENHGQVAMVGDGINDAPALVTANVGIAMGEGTDVALETADVVLMKNDLTKLPRTIKLANKMNRIVKQNLIFSVAVIILLIISNFFQAIDLPLGVIGHEGSTILVILNGLRLLRS